VAGEAPNLHIVWLGKGFGNEAWRKIDQKMACYFFETPYIGREELKEWQHYTE